MYKCFFLTLHDDILEIIVVISLKRSNVLYNPISNNNKNKQKYGDDSAQQYDDEANKTTLSTYKPPVQFP